MRSLPNDRYVLGVKRGNELHLVGAGYTLAVARLLWYEALKTFPQANLYERVSGYTKAVAHLRRIDPPRQN